MDPFGAYHLKPRLNMTVLMSAIFEKRAAIFEKRRAVAQDQKFEREVHRDRLLGFWAAELLGKQEADAAAYVRDVIVADIEEGGYEGIVKKLVVDLKPVKLSERDIWQKIEELLR